MIQKEELRFDTTLTQGLKNIEELIEKQEKEKSKIVPGEQCHVIFEKTTVCLMWLGDMTLFPQTGLPLGFLLSLNESVTLRRPAGSPDAAPRFPQPQDGSPISAQIAFGGLK